jgi:hypothetical protein
MQLQQQEQCEHIQLIRNDNKGEYLNYQQLICNPKHRGIWSTSAANKFSRLAQGVGGRVNPTNTIFFISKDQVSKDRMKDVAYGSFSCDMKQNQTKQKHTGHNSQQGEIESTTQKTLAHQRQT